MWNVDYIYIHIEHMHVRDDWNNSGNKMKYVRLMFVLCIEVSDLFSYNFRNLPRSNSQHPVCEYMPGMSNDILCANTHERDWNVKYIWRNRTAPHIVANHILFRWLSCWWVTIENMHTKKGLFYFHLQIQKLIYNIQRKRHNGLFVNMYFVSILFYYSSVLVDSQFHHIHKLFNRKLN